MFLGAVRVHNETSGGVIWQLHEAPSTENALMFLMSGADTCKRWAQNYQNRAHLYENLLYHTAAQADNNVNIMVAKLTSVISREAQRDNKALITLSVLALIFLPGNYIAVSHILALKENFD